jgi:hypothetical protein
VHRAQARVLDPLDPGALQHLPRGRDQIEEQLAPAPVRDRAGLRAGGDRERDVLSHLVMTRADRRADRGVHEARVPVQHCGRLDDPRSEAPPSRVDHGDERLALGGEDHRHTVRRLNRDRDVRTGRCHRVRFGDRVRAEPVAGTGPFGADPDDLRAVDLADERGGRRV